MPEYLKRDPAGMPQEITNRIAKRMLEVNADGHATPWGLHQLGADHSGDSPGDSGDTGGEVHILTAETMGVVPGAPDMWCSHVLRLIESGTLAAAGYDLAKLVDYALKTQHSDSFNSEVRNCVHAFWNRCEREKGNAQ